MGAYFQLLRHRASYRLLWIAQVISLTGDWFNTIAIIILVNRYTDGSALAISGLFLARTLPVFFISPFAGLIADRFNRKWILVMSNALRVIVVLGFLLVDSSADVILIYMLTILQFGLSAFFEPAYAAILPSLVQKDELLTANTLGSVTWSVMLTVGAAIGGLVTELLGIEAAIILDALTFALAACVLLLVQPAFTPAPEDTFTPSNPIEDFVGGWKHAREHQDIGLLTLVKGISQVGSIDVMIGVYAASVIVVGNEGATTLGVLFAAHGLGAILGPLLGDWISDGSESALFNWLTFGYIGIALGWFIFGIGGTLAIVAIGMVLRGMGGSIAWTYSTVLLQMKVPDRLLGRVFGLDFSIFQLLLALATLGAGVAIESLNIAPRNMVMLITAGSVLVVIWWWTALKRLKNATAN